MDLSLSTNQLLEFIRTYDVEQRTIDSFWECFEYYKKTYPDEFPKYFGDGDKTKVGAEIRSISLKLGNWPECTENYNHVVSYVPMRYDNLPVGEYRVWFSLDGEIYDDMFSTK